MAWMIPLFSAGAAGYATAGAATAAIGYAGKKALDYVTPKQIAGASPAAVEQAARDKLASIRGRRANTRITGNSGVAGDAPLRKQLLGQ